LGESIRGRLDKASSHSEMYADRLDNQMDEALGKAEIDIQLEERKRRLGLGDSDSLVEETAEEDEMTSSSSI
jgi:hypothetical protein